MEKFVAINEIDEMKTNIIVNESVSSTGNQVVNRRVIVRKQVEDTTKTLTYLLFPIVLYKT